MTTTALLDIDLPTTTAPPSSGVGKRVGPRERNVFLTATAAVMLHVADDNFLQPEPGVSAGDHLVSGLVPLGLLAIAAAGYLRVRAGARAVLAIVVGLMGMVTGFAEAGYYTVTVGPSGDDFTGLVAGFAGLALLGLAGAVLWRTRKPGPTRRRRYLRRGLLGLLGVALVAEVFAPFAGGYIATHVHTAGVPEAHLGAPYEDVTFTTSDGLEIHGWYVPSRNGAAVILPGRTKSQPHARMLVEHGYGVLLFDRRGEGASEGDPHLFAWPGARDVHAAVEFLEDQPEVDPTKIGGLGLSMSGEMLLQAAAESPKLAAVVSEGAGTRSLEEKLADYSAGMVVRGFHGLVAHQASLMLFSNESTPPNLVDLMPAIAPRPVLLIWAPNSPNGEGLNPTYQRQIGPSADIWTLHDAPHVGGLKTHPEEYERRVVDFFDQALLGR
ncbi:CocE/NonD family hydrolase [Nocardioides sp. HM23]|uniref:alpha/beta hydrolase n=1 Tax=Nocardioides bizhenqiangii TaxID=3095076 RepID=UPI002ACA0E15|nr:CocE/NonD family hydrolase [Nocardioides sp. HM23]MDZ5619397.1 CocE/NonD family hydrolase [Nocardioides sp. HM23]